jgi:hypothetical protein
MDKISGPFQNNKVIKSHGKQRKKLGIYNIDCSYSRANRAQLILLFVFF